MARVTLQSIADRVGVSRMTVSNAFSRPDQLSAELRANILAVAAELGYTTTASSPTRARTRTPFLAGSPSMTSPSTRQPARRPRPSYRPVAINSPTRSGPKSSKP